MGRNGAGARQDTGPGETRNRERHGTGRDKVPGETSNKGPSGARGGEGGGDGRGEWEGEGEGRDGGGGTVEKETVTNCENGHLQTRTIYPSIPAQGLPRWTGLTIATAHPDGRSWHLGGGQIGGGGEKETDGCGTECEAEYGDAGKATGSGALGARSFDT